MDGCARPSASRTVRQAVLTCRCETWKKDTASARGTHPKQSFIVRLDDWVTLAGCRAETVQISDIDASAAVADEIGLLHRAGHQGDAVAARTDHLSQCFLRKIE